MCEIIRQLKNQVKKIIFMLACILLLSNFISKPILAREVEGSYGDCVSVFSTGEVELESSNRGNTVTLTQQEFLAKNIRYDITPNETAVYTIILQGTDETGDTRDITYKLLQMSREQVSGKEVPLAAAYVKEQFMVVTKDTSNNTTRIDVILEKGVEYGIVYAGLYDNNVNENYNVLFNQVDLTVTKRTDIPQEIMAQTNIPSTMVSQKANSDSLIKDEAFESRLALNGKFHRVDFSEDEIKQFLDYGAEDDNLANGGSLEGILVDIVLFFGSVLLLIVETALNPNVSLSIDNILFNRFDQVIVDFSTLGGIQVPTEVTGGVITTGGLGDIINTLFSGLKNLAIIVYLVMFLYIGVKILLNVGGSEQKKYSKYLEYWLTGIVFLVFIPYFLPIIPAASNSFVAAMEDRALKIDGKYSTIEVLERLGYDTILLGEDAEAVELQNLVQDRIDELNAEIVGTPVSRQEAIETIDDDVKDSLSNFHQMSVEESAVANEKIDYIIEGIINPNFDNWNDEWEDKYQESISDLKQYLYKNNYISDGLTNQVVSKIPNAVANDPELVSYIRSIPEFVADNATNWDSLARTRYEEKLKTLDRMMMSKGLGNYYTQCEAAIGEAQRTSFLLAQNSAFQGLDRMFTNYKSAVLQEEIDDLKELKDNIANDIMTKLKTMAKEQNRLVYAIAWSILLYQMFAILFMYYKRVLTVVLLVIIFPVVMAFYVIDKMGDGKSQSLENWFRELLACIIVQVLHAAIYIIVVNVGIEVCAENPEQNWLVLIIAVSFLFPAEKIIRSILGINSTILGGLRNNFSMTALGAHAVWSAARGGGRAIAKVGSAVATKGVAGAVVAGTVGAAGAKFNAERQKSIDARNSKIEERDKKKEAAKKRRKAREDRIRNGNGSMTDNAINTVDKAKDKTKQAINGLAPVKNVKMTYNKIKNNKYVQGIAKEAGEMYQDAKVITKAGVKAAQVTAGLTLAAAETAETFSKDGSIGATAYTAQKSINELGGLG